MDTWIFWDFTLSETLRILDTSDADQLASDPRSPNFGHALVVGAQLQENRYPDTSPYTSDLLKSCLLYLCSRRMKKMNPDTLVYIYDFFSCLKHGRLGPVRLGSLSDEGANMRRHVWPTRITRSAATCALTWVPVLGQRLAMPLGAHGGGGRAGHERERRCLGTAFGVMTRHRASSRQGGGAWRRVRSLR